VDASERIVISDLGADTRVPEGRTPGRYVASIPEWWKAQFAFGGMTSTIALRAAEAAISRAELVPVSATAIFCSPVPCGDVVVDTDVLRTGRCVVHGQSVLRAAGSDQIGVRMLAIFGQGRESDLSFVDVTFPDDVAPPGECDVLVPPPGWPLAQSPVLAHNELRRAVGKAAWEEGWSPRRPRIASWTRYHKPARLADGSRPGNLLPTRGSHDAGRQPGARAEAAADARQPENIDAVLRDHHAHVDPPAFLRAARRRWLRVRLRSSSGTRSAACWRSPRSAPAWPASRADLGAARF
jgi:hypothetical protein